MRLLDPPDELHSHSDLIGSMATQVYNWLQSINQEVFTDWLLVTVRGSIKETLRVAQSTLDAKDRVTTGRFKPLSKTSLWGSSSSGLGQIPAAVGHHGATSGQRGYRPVCQCADDDGRTHRHRHVRSDPQNQLGSKAVLPFDITGFYEQIHRPMDESDPNSYDFHTLQINQAGIYAQGHWQVREHSPCSNEVNGGRYFASGISASVWIRFPNRPMTPDRPNFTCRSTAGKTPISYQSSPI